MPAGRIVFALLFIVCVLFAPPAAAAAKESAYDRVTRTSTLRCGYYIYPPETIMDPNTKQISGWAHDIVEEAGKALGIKIDWTEEITLDAIYEGVNSGRFDALCSTLWESPERSKHILFTQTVAFPTYYPLVRVDDRRFDKDLSLINSVDVKIAVMEGEYGEAVAKEKFPKAQRVSLPRGSQYTTIFQDVATKKADIVFAVPATGQKFIDNNPGVLRMIDKEVVLMPASVIMLNTDEVKLKNLLDSTLRHLILKGTVDDILKKYHPNDSKTNYFVSKLYATPVK
jgi:ABC-type amino acid transport substrate-binding protein